MTLSKFGIYDKASEHVNPKYCVHWQSNQGFSIHTYKIVGYLMDYQHYVHLRIFNCELKDFLLETE